MFYLMFKMSAYDRERRMSLPICYFIKRERVDPPHPWYHRYREELYYRRGNQEEVAEGSGLEGLTPQELIDKYHLPLCEDKK